jgi:hypothetical protein
MVVALCVEVMGGKNVVMVVGEGRGGGGKTREKRMKRRAWWETHVSKA